MFSVKRVSVATFACTCGLICAKYTKGGLDDSLKTIVITGYTTVSITCAYVCAEYAVATSNDKPRQIVGAFLMGLLIGPFALLYDLGKVGRSFLQGVVVESASNDRSLLAECCHQSLELTLS